MDSRGWRSGLLSARIWNPKWIIPCGINFVHTGAQCVTEGNLRDFHENLTSKKVTHCTVYIYNQFVTLVFVIHLEGQYCHCYRYFNTTVWILFIQLPWAHAVNLVHNMSNVQCSETESRLIDCPHRSGDGGSGGLWSDATKSCYPFSSGS